MKHLRRVDIDEKAEEVLQHFDRKALLRKRSPIYDVVTGLRERYQIPFHFDQDLGCSARGKKILGRFDFRPARVFVDPMLPYDSPRFRWTLCHEIGHFVLHRKIDPHTVSREGPQFIDTRTQLRFIRTACRSELEWIEWQANQFASSLLIPRPIVFYTLCEIQRSRGIARIGSIYLDDQPCNLRDYGFTLVEMAELLGVSRTVLRIRLLNLGLLTDARRSHQDHVQGSLRSFFLEASERHSSTRPAPQDSLSNTQKILQNAVD